MRYIRVENKFWNKCNLVLDKYKFLWYTGNSSRGTDTNYTLRVSQVVRHGTLTPASRRSNRLHAASDQN